MAKSYVAAYNNSKPVKPYIGNESELPVDQYNVILHFDTFESALRHYSKTCDGFFEDILTDLEHQSVISQLVQV